MEEATKPSGDKVAEVGEEEEFQDARDEGSITGKTSNTQDAAEDTQHGTAMHDAPHPPGGEGGQGAPAALQRFRNKQQCSK